ncbi:MAG: phosphomannose isomerase type II C-terminal cupin domain [Candidatus Magasanikbacteria bacterium]|nr:phosphomannose isomerase type II C-terminal cupin domain [Candidatus Magasanikbacteria bacterium]
MELKYYIEQRPWGQFKILLENKKCKVKEIIVKSGHRLSYQRHKKRDEHWIVVKGEAIVTLDDEEKFIKSGDSLNILKGQKHRVLNTGEQDLIFIETQTGSYFGEDDIERFSDDYNRV